MKVSTHRIGAMLTPRTVSRSMRHALTVGIGLLLCCSAQAMPIRSECSKMYHPIKCTCALNNGGWVGQLRSGQPGWFPNHGPKDAYYACVADHNRGSLTRSRTVSVSPAITPSKRRRDDVTADAKARHPDSTDANRQVRQQLNDEQKQKAAERARAAEELENKRKAEIESRRQAVALAEQAAQEVREEKIKIAKQAEADRLARLEELKEAEQAKLLAAAKDEPFKVFDSGLWVQTYPPGPHYVFNKLTYGAREVSLPNLGQATITQSDGRNSSNFQMSGSGFRCYYSITILESRKKMIFDFRGGDSVCLPSLVLELASSQ